MKKILLFFIFFISVFSLSAFYDAKGSAMAGALVSSSAGAVANWYNPARLSAEDKNDIVVSYQNPYHTANLTSLKVGYKQSLSSFAFGLYYDSLQAGNMYRNTHIGFNLSKRIDSIFHKTSLLFGGGLILNDRYINSGEFQTFHYFSADLGIDFLYQLSTKIKFNLASDLQYDPSAKYFKLTPELGIYVRKTGSLTININYLEKKYSLGVETKKMYDFLFLRAGFSFLRPVKSVTFIYSSGVGLEFDNFALDLSYIINPNLGGYGTASIRFIL